jgi:hypothetical protein
MEKLKHILIEKAKADISDLELGGDHRYLSAV